MRLYTDNAIRQASPEEEQQVLSLSVFQQKVSLWKPNSTGTGFHFGKNMVFSELIRHIANPDRLHPTLKDTVDKVVAGELGKSSLFGFCVATFEPDEQGKVRRLKHNHSTFTRLIQLDLDLKNEPNCTSEYVEQVLVNIFTVSGLGSHVLLGGKSISRKGLYLYLQCDTDDVEVLKVVVSKSYELLQKRFRFRNPSKTLDASVTDITNRLRYFAPDVDLVVNPSVQPIDTSLIRVEKKEYTSTYVSQAGNTFRELEIIKQAQNRLLMGYHQVNYKTGFHNDFLRFANSCIGQGVTRSTLEAFTQQQYQQLYNQEKRTHYLSELMRIIDCAEKKCVPKTKQILILNYNVLKGNLPFLKHSDNKK